MNVYYKEMSVNRPIVIRRGWVGEIEMNQVRAYLGEYVVFELPLASGAIAELRMPVEDALEEGLIIASDKIVFGPGEEDEDYE